MLREATVNCMLPPDCTVSHRKRHQTEPHKQQDTSVAKMYFFLIFKLEVRGDDELFPLYN
jgi:hypothetical protein